MKSGLSKTEKYNLRSRDPSHRRTNRVIPTLSRFLSLFVSFLCIRLFSIFSPPHHFTPIYLPRTLLTDVPSRDVRPHLAPFRNSQTNHPLLSLIPPTPSPSPSSWCIRVWCISRSVATMAPDIEFTLSLGHIPLITFTLRQWHFHFNDRLALAPDVGDGITANIATSSHPGSCRPIPKRIPSPPAH